MKHVFFFLAVILPLQIFSQIDSLHSFTTGSIKLGMSNDAVAAYTGSQPAGGDKGKWYKVKSGFEDTYLGFKINSVEVFCVDGEVRKISMKADKLYPNTENDKLMVAAFGKIQLKEGDTNLYNHIWHIGDYVVDFKGGRSMKDNEIILMFGIDLI